MLPNWNNILCLFFSIGISYYIAFLFYHLHFWIFLKYGLWYIAFFETWYSPFLPVLHHLPIKYLELSSRDIYHLWLRYVHHMSSMFTICHPCSPSAIHVHHLPSMFTICLHVHHIPSMFTICHPCSFTICNPCSPYVIHVHHISSLVELCSPYVIHVHHMSSMFSICHPCSPYAIHVHHPYVMFHGDRCMFTICHNNHHMSQ